MAQARAMAQARSMAQARRACRTKARGSADCASTTGSKAKGAQCWRWTRSPMQASYQWRGGQTAGSLCRGDEATIDLPAEISHVGGKKG